MAKQAKQTEEYAASEGNYAVIYRQVPQGASTSMYALKINSAYTPAEMRQQCLEVVHQFDSFPMQHAVDVNKAVSGHKGEPDKLLEKINAILGKK